MANCSVVIAVMQGSMREKVVPILKVGDIREGFLEEEKGYQAF